VLLAAGLNEADFILQFYVARGCIFSCVQPIYERAVSDLDPSRSMHRTVLVAHSLFIEGSHTAKNTATVVTRFEPYNLVSLVNCSTNCAASLKQTEI